MKIYFTVVVCIIALIGCEPKNNRDEKSIHTDELNFDTIYKWKSYQDCKPKTNNCTFIEFSYPQFKDVKGPLADSLSSLISHVFKNDEKNIFDIDSVQYNFIKEYHDFKLAKKGYDIPWFIEKKMGVVNQNTKWITLQLSEHSFKGGAHPNSYTFYKMIDKSSGHQLHLIDFFDSLAINKLTILGEPLFCAEKRISPQKGFEEAGFWFPNNHFALNDNFYFNEAGLTFFYNPYEVGPYVMGHTEITIPASKFIKLIKQQ
jgi:hypothetical protein